MKKLFSLCLLSLLAAGGMAQPYRVLDHNAIGWYTFNGDHKISDRWKIHTEYQWRRVDLIRTWQQSLARLGASYSLNKRVTLGGAYTLYVAYPYGDYPVADAGVPTIEHRSHVDVQISDQLGVLGLSHRFRLEQRWMGIGADDNPRRITSWEYQHRVRYQLAGKIPLKGPTIDDGELYANFFDELFIGFGRNVASNIFNQNRISAGLGYQFLDNLKLELNYLNQVSQHPEPDPVSAKPVFEVNNGFRLNVIYNLDLTKQ